MTRMMKDLVRIQGDFKPSVRLPGDFFDEELNRHFVQNYIPTQETLNIFLSIRGSLQPNSMERARRFSGTYGTGKSDLMLMIANYITRQSDDPLLATFFKRLRQINEDQAEVVYQARLGKPPFLLVLLQADTANTFSSFVLDGLARSLENVGLGNLLGNTYYKIALELLESWERDQPTNIQRFEKVLETKHGHTLNQLKHDLQGVHADSALDIFRAAFFDIMSMSFFPPSAVQRPSEAFTSVVESIVNKNLYSGVFLIIDEFSLLLQKLADSSTASDSKAIDDLAEVAVRSGPEQIHFCGVSLESFASAQGSTNLAQLAIERSGGRFFQHELLSQDMEELISASIEKLVPSDELFEGAQAQFDDLLTLTTKLWGNRATGRRDSNWLRKTIVRGCFPLHPLATYCLPRLNAVLAQNERTMFGFIWDKSRGLGSFIDETAAQDPSSGRIPLLSIDRLFSYFEANIKEKRPDLLLAYQQGSSTLSRQQLEDGLEGRLLRALVMLEVAEGDSNLRADQELLRHAVGLAPSQISEVITALEQLGQNGVAYPSRSGNYQLVRQGRANPLELRRLIDRSALGITESPIKLLNEHHKKGIVDASTYNSAHGTERKLVSSFISTAGLTSPATLTQELQKAEGLVWYVVAPSEQELDQARSNALQLTRQHDLLVVAIPQYPTDILERLKRKIALDNLRKNPQYQTSDYQDLLADTGLVGQDCKEALERELQKFEQPSNFDWYSGGRTDNITMPIQLEMLASNIMKKIFPKTPAHKIPQHLGQNPKPASVSKCKEVLNQILIAPFQRANSTTKRSPTDVILLEGAKVLGLIYDVRQERGFTIYDVGIPKYQPLSREVWELIDNQLKNATPWADIVEILKTRPYGMYKPVLQLFMASFYRFNREYIEIYSGVNLLDQPISVTGDTIVSMVEAPTNYTIRYRPLTDQERKFLRGLLERNFPLRGAADKQREGVISLRNHVAKLLRQQLNEIKLLSTQPSLEELTDLFRETSPEIIDSCMILMEIAKKADESTIANALLEDLPQSMGLSVNSINWTETELDQALTRLESGWSLLQQISQKLRERLAANVGLLFGLTASSESEESILEGAKTWRRERIGNVRLVDVEDSSNVGALLAVLDNKQDDFEQAFLIKLVELWNLQPFKEWKSLSMQQDYLQRLEQAKREAEEKAVTLYSVTVVDEGRETVNGLDVQPIPSQIDNTEVLSKENEVKEATIAPASQPAYVEETQPPSVALLPETSHMATPLDGKRAVAEQPSKLSSYQSTDDVELAFLKIKSIFQPLSSDAQQRLLKRLAAEYKVQ